MIGFRHLIQLSLAVYLVSGLPAAELPNNNNKDKVQVFYSRSDRSSAPVQQQQQQQHQQQQPIEDPSLKVEVALPASSAAEYYQPQRQVQPVAPVNTNPQQPSNVDGSGGAFFNKFASFMPTNFNLPTSSISSSACKSLIFKNQFKYHHITYYINSLAFQIDARLFEPQESSNVRRPHSTWRALGHESRSSSDHRQNWSCRSSFSGCHQISSWTRLLQKEST